MMTVEEAVKKHNAEAARSIRAGGGCPLEADEYLNLSARDVVRAYQEKHAGCWVGKINRPGGQDKGEPLMWRISRNDTLHTFEADFVVPVYDRVLDTLLQERDTAPYEGTGPDAERIRAIQARISEVGGTDLLWS